MNRSFHRRLFWLGVGLSLALLLPAPRSCAQAPGNFIETPPAPTIVTWDGTNGVAINALVGAERFYNEGVWGQLTVTANVEAGLVWNGHESTRSVTNFYVPPGASGETDMHATWVGSILAGYDASADPANYPYYKLGIAPSTRLSSGAIATGWYNQTDPVTKEQNTYFDITPQTFYSTYHHYFTTNWTHTVSLGVGISYSYSAPTDVINSSWGYGDPLGNDSYTMAADGLARANPNTTLVLAAGNSTTSANPSNNVGGPASGYNSISVGAVGDGSYNQFNTVATFSSRGPQDYYDPVHGVVSGVRAPVDLVAPGTSIVAAYYGGQTGGNGAALSTTQPDTTAGADNYYNLGLAGTSFAAPIVAGGVSLLKSLSYQAGMSETSRDTRVIKSVLMNSATKLPGWDNGQHLNAEGVTVTTQSVDWVQGAGMLNLNKAFDQYYSGTQDVPGTGGGTVSATGWDLGSIGLSLDPETVAANDYTFHLTLQAASVLDVTLTWFRNLGTPVFGDNTNPYLQTLTTQDLGFANLQLEIWNADFTKLYATSMSQYNNVEELHYTLPEDGNYGIRVSYPSQMFGEAEPEEYGLAWNVTTAAVPEPGVTSLSCFAGLVLLLLFARKQTCQSPLLNPSSPPRIKRVFPSRIPEKTS